MLSPNVIKQLHKLGQGGLTIILGGEIDMSSKYQFDKIENQNGALSIGDYSSANYYQSSNDSLESITEQLIALINKNTDMPDDSKEELVEIVSEIASQSKAEKPSKTVIKTLYDSAEKLISLAVKSAELVTALDKWKGLIVPLFN